MRKGLPILVVAAMCAIAAPAASAQCGLPKGVYVANTELANAVYLFTGRTEEALGGGNVATLVGASAELAAAGAAYPVKLAAALSEPAPPCGARRAPARRTRRASAGRRR